MTLAVYLVATAATDDDLLVQAARQEFTDDAGTDVGRTAGGEMAKRLATTSWAKN